MSAETSIDSAVSERIRVASKAPSPTATSRMVASAMTAATGTTRIRASLERIRASRSRGSRRRRFRASAAGALGQGRRSGAHDIASVVSSTPDPPTRAWCSGQRHARHGRDFIREDPVWEAAVRQETVGGHASRCSGQLLPSFPQAPEQGMYHPEWSVDAAK